MKDKVKEIEQLKTDVVSLKIRLKKIEDFLRDIPDLDDYMVEDESGFYKEVDEKLFKKAKRVVQEYDRASASLLQRRLNIGWAYAAKVLDKLEEKGIVSAPSGSKPRDVLVKK